MPPLTTDLAIIGAGASGTHALLALLQELSTAVQEVGRPARIVVIDRHPQFFSGVAYGSRSGPASLTLSTLHGFLPDEERARFIAWLTSRDVMHDTDVDPAWAARHRAEIAAGHWDELFIPRRLYGRYLADRATAAIRDARSRGVAECTLVNADVTTIERSGGRFLLTASDGGGTQIDAAVVVLAAGSPPARRLRADDAPVDGLIDDIYDPGLGTTVRQLRRRLVDLPVDGREVLVVGGNAAALEFISASSEVMRELRARVTVLSPTGRPRHWRRRRDAEVAELVAMAALRTRAAGGEPVTAKQLYEAVVADLEATVDAGTDVAAVQEIVTSIPSFLPLLNAKDRSALAGRYGIPISNLLRQDCGDAIAIIETAIAMGAVVFRAGRYRHCRPEGRYFRVTATDDGGRQVVHDTRYGAIVGATGFEGVATTRAPVIQNLLRTGLAGASNSDAGLRVDSRFQASPGLFVIGPLLAGNAHRNMLIWHAESVQRIMAITRDAASDIAQELRVVTSGACAARSGQN